MSSVGYRVDAAGAVDHVKAATAAEGGVGAIAEDHIVDVAENQDFDAAQAVAGSGAGAQGAQVASEIKADRTEAGIRHYVDAFTAEHLVGRRRRRLP